MIWQDYVVAVAMFAFVYSLIPQIAKGFKARKPLVTFQTSLIYGSASLVLGMTFATLGLVFTATMNLVVAGLWGVLLYQNLKYRK